MDILWTNLNKPEVTSEIQEINLSGCKLIK